MNGRGPKSSGDSEEVENPNISSPGIRIPHSSLQDTSTSSLISPVNHLALQDDRQYPRPDRPNVSARSDAANRTFMADEQHRPMLSDEYQPQYNHHNAANEIQTYIETQPSSEAPSLEYLSRNATHPFAPPSSEQMVLRDRGHYATLQQNQPPLTYPGWPPSTFNLQHFASPVNYSDNPTSTHSAHPSHSQPHYQLPPPANGIGALPPLHSHQPDSPFARVQPHYELRTSSQNNSHPHHHGMPHTEYTGFSFEDKPYGERS